MRIRSFRPSKAHHEGAPRTPGPALDTLAPNAHPPPPLCAARTPTPPPAAYLGSHTGQDPAIGQTGRVTTPAEEALPESQPQPRVLPALRQVWVLAGSVGAASAWASGA